MRALGPEDESGTGDGMSAPTDGPIRWNLSRAADEFGSHRDTIRKALLAGGHQADDAGTYSTRQIHQALSGDREAHKARLEKAQADRVELDNAERRRSLIPVEDALKLARKFTFAAQAKIRAVADLTDEQKNAIIAELRGLKDADFEATPDDDVT